MLDVLILMQVDEDIKGAIKVKDRESGANPLGRSSLVVTKSKSKPIGKLTNAAKLAFLTLHVNVI